MLAVAVEHDRASRYFESGAAKKLTLRVFDSFHAEGLLSKEWDEAVERLTGSVYMSFDWLKTWWDFYGAGTELKLFIVSDPVSIVAALPVYISKVPLLGVRIARLVGSNIPPKVFNPPVERGCGPSALALILQYLIEQSHCDVLSFGPASDRCAFSDALVEAAENPKSNTRILNVESDVHTVWELPDSIDSYFQSLSKNERKNRRKYELRVLAKDFPDARVEVLRDPARVAEHFPAFAEQHAIQWSTERKPGHFGAWPLGFEYNLAQVKVQSARDRVRFVNVVAQGRCVASQYCFYFGGIYYWELPSRLAGPDWDRYSLGPTGIVTMLGAALNEGVRCVEGGLAHYEYKLRLGAIENRVRTVSLVRSDKRKAFAVSLARAFSLTVRVVYHKIWYRRITTRLPRFFWKPISRVWLLLDF